MLQRSRMLSGLPLLAALVAGWALARPLRAAGGAPAPRVAHRVVSLDPSLSAILVALGARDALVGVDDFSAHSLPALQGLPTVGGLANPSLEALLALRPDLVVLVPSAEQRGFRDRLASLGVPRLELDPVSFEDVLASILRLGDRVGREAEARRRVGAIRRARARVAQAVSGRGQPSVVLVLQRDPLFIVGRGSFVDDMLRAVGARNLGARLSEPYPQVSREWLIAAAPQVLLDAARDPAPAARYWSRWSSLPAVRSGRVESLPERVVTLPGPELDRALWLLARAIHGSDLGRPAPAHPQRRAAPPP